MNLIDTVNEVYANPKVASLPNFKPGDTIAVHAQITEGDKTRIQIYQGVCVAIKHRNKISGHFRVRKTSSGTGVERVFPYHSPVVQKVELVQKGKSRRAKHFYLRERSGKSARIAIDYDRKA